MDRLIHFASETGVEVWMRVNQISAFYYLEKEDRTDVFICFEEMRALYPMGVFHNPSLVSNYGETVCIAFPIFDNE